MRMVNDQNEMRAKKKKFAAAFVETVDIKAAAAQAGLSKEIGKRLVSVPEVKAEIEEGLSKAAIAAGVSRQWVLERLREVVERCLQARPVLDKRGNETGLFVFDASGANRALELIGKHLRIFEDEDRSAKNIGQSILRLLAQEAQEGRFTPVATDAVIVPADRVPPPANDDGTKTSLPASASPPVDTLASPPGVTEK